MRDISKLMQKLETASQPTLHDMLGHVNNYAKSLYISEFDASVMAWRAINNCDCKYCGPIEVAVLGVDERKPEEIYSHGIYHNIRALRYLRDNVTEYVKSNPMLRKLSSNGNSSQIHPYFVQVYEKYGNKLGGKVNEETPVPFDDDDTPMTHLPYYSPIKTFALMCGLAHHSGESVTSLFTDESMIHDVETTIEKEVYVKKVALGMLESTKEWLLDYAKLHVDIDGIIMSPADIEARIGQKILKSVPVAFNLERFELKLHELSKGVYVEGIREELPEYLWDSTLQGSGAEVDDALVAPYYDYYFECDDDIPDVPASVYPDCFSMDITYKNMQKNMRKNP